MDSLTTALAWAGGALAAATPFLAWAVKKYIDKAISLRFDLLKAEHGVKFAWQHQQVTSVATEVHEALVQAVQAFGMVAGSGYKVDTGPTDADVKLLLERASNLGQVFAKKSMFLPKKLRDAVDKQIATSGFALNLVMQAAMYLKAGDTGAMSQAMGAAFNLVVKELHPETQALEPEFRSLLLGDTWGD